MGCGGSSARTARAAAQDERSRLVNNQPLAERRQNDIEAEDTDGPHYQHNAGSIIQFSTDIFYAAEGVEDSISIDVVRFGDVSGTATVHYKTVDASAKHGDKYIAVSGQLVFEPGASSKTFEVEILDDDRWNATLEFSIVLFDNIGAGLGKYLYQARVKVIDDDAFPTNKYAEEFQKDEYEEIPGVSLMTEFLRLCWRDPIIKSKTIWIVFFYQLKGLHFFVTMYLQLYLIEVVLVPGGKEGPGEHGHEHEHRHEHEHGHASEHGHDSESSKRMLLSVVLNATQKLFQGIRFLHEHGGGEGGEEGGEGEAAEEEEEGGWFMYRELLVPGSHLKTAIVVAVIYCAPCIIIHLTDIYIYNHIRLRGTLRKMLQANLLRKFLNYKEDIRPAIRLGQLQMIMVRDVREVVEFGYMKILVLFRIMGKLSFAVFFILAESPAWVLAPLVVIPIFLVIFLCLRENITKECTDIEAKCQDEVVNMVTDTMENYRLIADFFMRPRVVDEYEKSIDRFHGKESDIRAVMLNNSSFASSIMTTFLGCYIVFAAIAVSQQGDKFSIGQFVTTINVLREMGVEIAEISLEMVEIQRTFEPLSKIAQYMNKPTDVLQRKQIADQRRLEGEVQRQSTRRNLQNSKSNLPPAKRPGERDVSAGYVFPVDHVRIMVKNLTFQYQVGLPILNKVSETWAQGGLYCLVGPAHEGKSSLLKLLGQVCLPSEDAGMIFVPPHLRILHISNEFLTLRGSLLRNLIMNVKIQTVGGMERVKKICTMLNFEPQLMKYLDSAVEDDNEWRNSLTDTSSVRIILARAFIMNPELMLLHKPTSAVNGDEVNLIMDMLRRHVEEKGLELSIDERQVRRPRTVFMTANSAVKIDGVDKCYEVSQKNGILELERPPSKDAGKSPKNGGNKSPKKQTDNSAARSPDSAGSREREPSFGMNPAPRAESPPRRSSNRSTSPENPSPKMGPGKPKRSSLNQDRANQRY